MTENTGPPPVEIDLLIAGGLVVTLDPQRRVLEDGAVAIAGEPDEVVRYVKALAHER